MRARPYDLISRLSHSVRCVSTKHQCRVVGRELNGDSRTDQFIPRTRISPSGIQRMSLTFWGPFLEGAGTSDRRPLLVHTAVSILDPHSLASSSWPEAIKYYFCSP